MIKANEYRTVTCGELREENIGQEVRVAGWVENIRDHGGVMFLDIRDQYGVEAEEIENCVKVILEKSGVKGEPV